VIVCHCKVVNDEAVAHAVDGGARTLSQVCRATGAGRGCGACVFSLRRLLCQHQGAATDSVVQVAGAVAGAAG
jgi:bacterioferritin-associated ferredoxin